MSDLVLIPDYPVLTGIGKLSGYFKLDTLPGGITYSDITIRAYYVDPLGGRFNGIQAAQVNCQSSGLWIIEGISEHHRYNVVISVPGYNDIIYSNKATSNHVPPTEPVVENLVFEVTSEGRAWVSTSFTLIPTAGGAGGFIDISDGGSYELQEVDQIEHIFTSPGTYQITISGDLDAVLFDIQEPTKILSWGKELKGVEEDGMIIQLYSHGSNLISVPDHLPPWITTLQGFFSESPEFNQDISSWNTKNVKNMDMLFLGAQSFNQDLSGWCVPHITREPYGFGSHIYGWTLPKPVWGTCPNGEDLVEPEEPIVPDHPEEPEEPEDPAVGSEYLTIKFHNAGDVTSYRKMTALGLDGLPLETVEARVMEGVNKYTLTVGVDDIVKFKFDPITGLPPGMEGMTSELYGVSHGGLDITVLELPNTQDAPSLSKANNVIVEAALPSVTTNLRGMFSGTRGTISGISDWDVSKVTDMSDMFLVCNAFNHDISSWDVSNVTNMSKMFFNCKVFNQDLSNWDVHRVTDMSRMFSGASVFNSDISGWDTSNVTNMTDMFSGAGAFNGDLSHWDVSKVTDMSYMFSDAYVFNSDISSWDVSNVTDMMDMFSYTEAFNQDLSGWCVRKITSEPYGFDEDAEAWTLPKPVWGTCPSS